MNISFKSLASVAVIAAAFIVGSCAPTGPSSPENDLAVSRKAVSLTAANLKDSSDVSLVCQCPFMLTVVSYSGDTSAIKYSVPTFALGQVVNRYTVVLEGDSTATPGAYTSQLILKGGSEGFLDTITTTYTVQ